MSLFLPNSEPLSKVMGSNKHNLRHATFVLVEYDGMDFVTGEKLLILQHDSMADFLFLKIIQHLLLQHYN